MTKDTWTCTTCGRVQGEPATKLLDSTYGTQKCISCNVKRIFHLEVNDDSAANRQVHVPGSERHAE